MSERTMTQLRAFLGHDDARRVTPDDVVAFKDHRLASVNPRTAKRLTPKTVNDADLAALKAVFNRAEASRVFWRLRYVRRSQRHEQYPEQIFA